MEKLNRKQFIINFKIDEELFTRSNLDWIILEKIYSDFLKRIKSLEQIAEFVANSLMKLKKVHSVRYRIKDPEHLIEKIIRKRIENPERIITLDNYLSEITDLIGIRAIHLFKEEWLFIHRYILKTWNLKETPVGYFRVGDTKSYTDSFLKQGCEIKEHEHGYRSVHYLIESSPGKEKLYAEIQVRTIFEEGWSEIDHRIRYPYDTENDIYNQILLILNRLAGSADEMGTFIRNLQRTFDDKEWDFEERISEKNTKIRELEDKIQNLKIKTSEKNDIKSDLESIKLEDYAVKDLNKMFENLFKTQEPK